mgnify:CR=1 FL=1
MRLVCLPLLVLLPAYLVHQNTGGNRNIQTVELTGGGNCRKGIAGGFKQAADALAFTAHNKHGFVGECGVRERLALSVGAKYPKPIAFEFFHRPH